MVPAHLQDLLLSTAEGARWKYQVITPCKDQVQMTTILSPMRLCAYGYAAVTPSAYAIVDDRPMRMGRGWAEVVLSLHCPASALSPWTS